MSCSEQTGGKGQDGHGGGQCHGHEGRVSCKEICQFLCDYVEGELPVGQCEAFQFHMKECRSCAEYLRQYEGTIRASKRCMCPGHVKPPPVPEDMVTAIMKALGRPCCGPKKPTA